MKRMKGNNFRPTRVMESKAKEKVPPYLPLPPKESLCKCNLTGSVEKCSMELVEESWKDPNKKVEVNCSVVCTVLASNKQKEREGWNVIYGRDDSTQYLTVARNHTHTQVDGRRWRRNWSGGGK